MTGPQDDKTLSRTPSSGESAAPKAEAPSVPAQDEEHSGATPWGSPWGATEAGWDGSGAPPPPPPSASDAPSSPGGGSMPPVPAGAGNPPAQQSAAQENTEKQRDESRPMTLMEHLGELRSRLIRCCIAVGIAFAACYGVADILFKALRRPLVEALPPGSKLIFTALPEAFFVYLQVGLVAAIFLASPFIFYQIWAFIAPGLYDEEKRHIIPIAACSAFFFLAGASFCYLVVFPFAFTFFVGFATDDIAAMPSLSEYLGFALKLLIAFGLIFEMPLFSFFLARMGLITAELMRKVRRYAILAIFIVAAILTPPDVMSQMLMAIPMLLLYELSIWVAAAFGRKPKNTAEATADNDGKQEAA